MPGPLQEVLLFLINTLFDLYIALLIIRMLLGYTRANFYNPLSQFLVNATNPVLVPLRRIIPSIGKVDTSTLVAALGLKLVQLILMYLIAGKNINIAALLILSIGELLRLIVWIYIIALIIQAVMSWVGNTQGNPAAPLLNSLTEPLLRPIRKFVPLVGMIDLSPLVAILLLQIALILLGSFGL